MWTQHWTFTEMNKVDREVCKIIVECGGKYPCGSTTLLYLPMEKTGRGLRSVKNEYEAIEIKAVVKLYENLDPTMQMTVREILRRYQRP